MDRRMKERLEANIWKLKLNNFLLNFFVYSPILFIAFNERGISLTGIGLLLTIATVAGFLFEVPTGILADRWGRKHMLSLAAVAGIITMLLWTSNIYLALLAGMVFRSLLDAAVSGADTALLYETLSELKREDEYTKHNGERFSLGMLAFGIAGITASLLPTHTLYTYHFIATALAFTAALIISTSMQETRHRKKVASPLSHLRASFAFVSRHREVYKIVLYSAVLGGSMLLVIVHFQFFLKQAGISTQHFGLAYAGMGVVSAIASYYGHAAEKRMGEKRMLLALPGLLTAGILLLIIGSAAFPIILGIVLIEIVIGFKGAILNTYLQRHLESANRSTVESLSAFYLNVYKGILYLLGGFIAEMWSIDVAAVFTLAIMLFFITPPLWFLLKEHDRDVAGAKG